MFLQACQRVAINSVLKTLLTNLIEVPLTSHLSLSVTSLSWPFFRCNYPNIRFLSIEFGPDSFIRLKAEGSLHIVSFIKSLPGLHGPTTEWMPSSDLWIMMVRLQGAGWQHWYDLNVVEFPESKQGHQQRGWKTSVALQAASSLFVNNKCCFRLACFHAVAHTTCSSGNLVLNSTGLMLYDTRLPYQWIQYVEEFVFFPIFSSLFHTDWIFG